MHSTRARLITALIDHFFVGETLFQLTTFDK